MTIQESVFDELQNKLGKAMRLQRDLLMEHMDRKFDSHAPTAGVTSSDETVISVDNEEERVAEIKVEVQVTEEEVDCAQKKVTVVEDANTTTISKQTIKYKLAQDYMTKRMNQSIEISSARSRLNARLAERTPAETSKELAEAKQRPYHQKWFKHPVEFTEIMKQINRS